MANVFVKGNNLYNHAKMDGLNMNPGWRPTPVYNNSVFCNYQDTTTSSCSGSNSNSGLMNFLNILTMGLSIFGMVNAFKSMNAATNGASGNNASVDTTSNSGSSGIEGLVKNIKNAKDQAAKQQAVNAAQSKINNNNRQNEVYKTQLKEIENSDAKAQEKIDDLTTKNKDIDEDLAKLDDPKQNGLGVLEDQLAAEKAKSQPDTAKIREIEQQIKDKKAENEKKKGELRDQKDKNLKEIETQQQTKVDNGKKKSEIEGKMNQIELENKQLQAAIESSGTSATNVEATSQNSNNQPGTPVANTGAEATSTGNSYPFTTEEQARALSAANTTTQTGNPETVNPAVQTVDGSNQTDNKNNGTTQEDGMRKSLISEAQALGIYNKDDETKSMESLKLEITEAKNKVIDQIHEINKDAKTDNLSASELVSMLNTLKAAQKSNISFGTVRPNNDGTNATNPQEGNDNQQPVAKTPKTYTVHKKGEALWMIAEQFNVNINDLYQANKEKLKGNPNHIEIGWELVIPAKKTK